LVRKPQGKRLLGRTRHRWEDDIRMGLREGGWGVLDWIHLAQDTDHWQVLMIMVMNFGFHKSWRIS